MTTRTPLDLTVVIPTFNRSHELVRALDSLVAQTDDFEVIVCDDGSTEDIASAIQYWVYGLIADGFYWLRMAVANK